MPVQVEFYTHYEEVDPVIVHTDQDVQKEQVEEMSLRHGASEPKTLQSSWIRYRGLVTPVLVVDSQEVPTDAIPSAPTWRWAAMLDSWLWASPITARDWAEAHIALCAYYKGLVDASLVDAPIFTAEQIGRAVMRAHEVGTV